MQFVLKFIILSIMSLSARSFSLKCLKKTTSLYTTSLKSALSTNIFNYSYSKSKLYNVNDVSVANKNFRLYSTSPISWNDVDNIIAAASKSEESTIEKKTKGTFIILILNIYN